MSRANRIHGERTCAATTRPWRPLRHFIIAGLLAGLALAAASAGADAAAVALPPKPADDPWPDLAPIDPSRIATANADPRVQRGYQLLIGDGGNWAGNEAAINFQFAADYGNPVGQAARCAIELANSQSEGDVTWALRDCRPAADQGYAAAQLMMGLLLQAKGVEFDPRKSAHWLRQAARQGDPVALLSLAEAYLKGIGVPADRQRGLDLLRQVTTSAQPAGAQSAAWRDYARYLRDTAPGTDAATQAAGRQALRAAALAEFWPAQLRLSWLSRSGAEDVPVDVKAAHLYGNEALTNLIRAIVTPVGGP